MTFPVPCALGVLVASLAESVVHRLMHVLIDARRHAEHHRDGWLPSRARGPVDIQWLATDGEGQPLTRRARASDVAPDRGARAAHG